MPCHAITAPGTEVSGPAPTPCRHPTHRPQANCRGSSSRARVAGLSDRFRSAGSGSSSEQARPTRCAWSRLGCSWFRSALPCVCYHVRGPAPPGSGPGLVVRLFSAAPWSRRSMVRRSRRRQPWLPPGPPRPVSLPKKFDRRFRPDDLRTRCVPDRVASRRGGRFRLLASLPAALVVVIARPPRRPIGCSNPAGV
jgi:hypothetical protein